MRVRRKRPAWTKESETYAQRNREKTIMGSNAPIWSADPLTIERRCAISLPKNLTFPLRFPRDITQNQSLTGIASRRALN